jgi:hypothetical protein
MTCMGYVCARLGGESARQRGCYCMQRSVECAWLWLLHAEHAASGRLSARCIGRLSTLRVIHTTRESFSSPGSSAVHPTSTDPPSVLICHAMPLCHGYIPPWHWWHWHAVGTRHAIYAIVASLWHGGMAVFHGKWDASPEIVNIHATKPRNGMACRAKWETGAKVDAKTVNAVTSWGIASCKPMH